MHRSHRTRAAGRMARSRARLALVVSIAALAGVSLAPAGAAAQSGGFPIYGEDKWLGSVNLFTNPTFTQYFNQVTPENAGKWGSAAGLTRTSPMRWGQLDQAYGFATANGFPFNFHVLLWGNQQPTWMSSLPPDEQLLEINRWFAAVAERYADIEWLQVVNEGTWDPPDCEVPKNEGTNCASSGNYVRALGGYNGTDGTGHDWILNAFRLAREYFPDTKLMINDVLITNSPEATTEYLEIIESLKREDLVDAIGVQGHAFVFTPGVPGPTIPGRPWEPEADMAVHEANLDRLAATGLPIQITELDIDGTAAGGVPGDEVQLADYRRVVPTFWEHPGVEGITLWGWRQPSHWRNAQNAPIVLSDGTLKPAGHWLFNYVNAIPPVISPGQRFTFGEGAGNRVGTVEADDWASQIGRPHLRTFTWQITGGTGAGAFAIEPSTGEIRVANPSRLEEDSTYSLGVRVSDGFHTSDEADVTIVTEDLAHVDTVDVSGTVPSTLSLALSGNASFGELTPGVANDYETSLAATVTSTAGDATLTIVDSATTSPGRLVNGAFSLEQPVEAAVTGGFAPVTGSPLTLHSYTGPTSNDPLTIRFRQAIGASEPLRTGAYRKALTFTLSTTAP